MCHCIFLGINPRVTLSHDFVLIARHGVHMSPRRGDTNILSIFPRKLHEIELIGQGVGGSVPSSPIGFTNEYRCCKIILTDVVFHLMYFSLVYFMALTAKMFFLKTEGLTKDDNVTSN